jgi:hypothetical protein
LRLQKLPFFINVSRNFSVQFALWKWNQRSVNWSQSQHSWKKSIFAKAQIVRKSRTAHLFDIFRSQVWEKSSTFCKARVMFLFYRRRQFERVKDDWEETTFQIFRTKSSPSFCTAHTVHCRIKFWNQKTRKREVGQFQVIRQQNKSKLRDHSFNKYFLIRVFSRKISLTEFLSEESKNLEEVKAVGRFSKVVKLDFFLWSRDMTSHQTQTRQTDRWLENHNLLNLTKSVFSSLGDFFRSAHPAESVATEIDFCGIDCQAVLRKGPHRFQPRASVSKFFNFFIKFYSRLVVVIVDWLQSFSIVAQLLRPLNIN